MNLVETKFSRIYQGFEDYSWFIGKKIVIGIIMYIKENHKLHIFKINFTIQNKLHNSK